MSTFRNATGVTSTHRIARAAALGVAMLIGGGVSAQPAQAAYTVTLEQMGSNVVATGSGTIDLTGLSPTRSRRNPEPRNAKADPVKGRP
jgi:hypothetical protein